MSHEHRQHPERFYDDEGEAYPDDPFPWFDRPGKPAPSDEAQPWESPDEPLTWDEYVSEGDDG